MLYSLASFLSREGSAEKPLVQTNFKENKRTVEHQSQLSVCVCVCVCKGGCPTLKAAKSGKTAAVQDADDMRHQPF